MESSDTGRPVIQLGWLGWIIPMVDEIIPRTLAIISKVQNTQPQLSQLIHPKPHPNGATNLHPLGWFHPNGKGPWDDFVHHWDDSSQSSQLYYRPARGSAAANHRALTLLFLSYTTQRILGAHISSPDSLVICTNATNGQYKIAALQKIKKIL